MERKNRNTIINDDVTSQLEKTYERTTGKCSNIHVSHEYQIYYEIKKRMNNNN